ncbi:MAG: DNA-3-methyladenine glycosylase I [Negativicutes bacterium]|jgi:DNA-3-methyladenine glycosylase I
MGSQKLCRCIWAQGNSDIYRKYHDSEWGVPVYDDAKLFEMLVLESFQAGLSWLIILKKREAFRLAFENFDPVKIVKFDDRKIQELLNNEGIVRNKAKINATISNAKIFLSIQKEFGSFSGYLWGFTDHKVIKNQNDSLPTQTELSDRIAMDMKKRGAKFFGTVIVYSYLQAVGVVNDHETGCYKYNN